jgi:hypothetical protein
VGGFPELEYQKVSEEVLAGRSALELLQSIYRDPSQPIGMRMRAATIAIAYESPRLAVTAYLSNADHFAARLDKAIENSRSPKVIEHRRDERSDEP